MRILIAGVVVMLFVLGSTMPVAGAAEEKKAVDLPVCTSAMSEGDVIAIDYDVDGNPTEYHRTPGDAAKVVERLREKVTDDPAITKSKYWRDEMLTTDYWLKTACGGQQPCSNKTCSGSAKCQYSNIGMAGCKCF